MKFQKGQKSPHKGLTLEQEYGIEKAKEIREKLSIAQRKRNAEGRGNGYKKGHTSWIKGKHLSEEHKKKISKARLDRKKRLGYTNSPETIRKISLAKKGKYTGENSPSWKGGEYITENGYKRIRIDGKYPYKHKVVWIRHNKMPVPQGFVVHHKDMDKLNNDIDNLLLLPNDTHSALHHAHRRGEL